MSTNEQLRDSAIRHAAYLAKYGEGLAEKVVELLNEVDDDLVAKLAAGLATDLGEKRIRQLLEEISVLNSEVYGKTYDLLNNELTDQASLSAEYEAKSLNDAVGIPALRATLPQPAKLAVLATTSPIDGYLLKSWTDQMDSNRLGRVEKAIRLGITQGETIDQIVKRIKGTKAAGYKDGILDISRRSAKTLAITANATVAARAREQVWQANSDIISKVLWVSTLDTRTSPICQSLDGKTWDLDEPRPKPAIHPRCRSINSVITKRFDQLGIPRKEIPKTTRASMDGQVPAKTTYPDWLQKQSNERQDDILGKARADLFRQGKLEFKDLYRQDGSYRSLDELRAKLDLPVPKSSNLQKPEPKAFSPINPKITDDTVEVIPRLKAQRKLDDLLSVGAKDSRYDAQAEFKNTKGKGWGRSTFPTDLTDEAASMLVAIQPELDAISDAFGIPRLRAYRAISGAKTMGNMGDGSMGINPTYFNAFAAKIGGKSPDALLNQITEKRDNIKSELGTLRVEIDAIKTKLKSIGANDPAWLGLYDQYADKAKIYNSKVKQFNTISKKAGATARKGTDTVSTWQAGDDIAKRPFNAADYFSGIDRARNVLYHEMAHHVHQMYKRTQRRERGYRPPLESELLSYWRDTFFNVKPETRAKRDRQASQYALTNEKEWFAENFSLFMMGKPEMADPDAIAIIERLLNEQN